MNLFGCAVVFAAFAFGAENGESGFVLLRVREEEKERAFCLICSRPNCLISPAVDWARLDKAPNTNWAIAFYTPMVLNCTPMGMMKCWKYPMGAIAL